ncbi:MAG TPA: hypothetical protein VH143_24345 [Kofleriaceae bacterium]|nr:hypothetical protein [Kofleriaceae bacterium]
MKLAVLLALLSIAACRGSSDEPKLEDTERHSRLVEPPAKAVRALPPHAIRADGVGPYKLGASLSELNDLLPSGPHIAQIDIANVIRVSVLRAEDGAVLIGGEPQGKAAFVSVVGALVARTESGVHVGSTRAELVQALGAPLVDLDHARDPHIIVPAQMPELRAVLDGDRVIGLVVAPASKDKAPADACTRPAIETTGSDGTRLRFGACMSGNGDVVSLDGDELSVRTQDDRMLASVPVHGAVFAAALRAPDGRDEVYVVSRVDEPTARTWSVAGFRLEGARLVRVTEPQVVYQVTTANARWIGADLRDVDLVLDIAGRADGIEVGGLLTTRVTANGSASLRDLLVLAPFQVPRLHRKSGAADNAAAPSGAGGSATP